MWWIIGTVWIICGALTFGRTLYDFEYNFPFFAYPNRRQDMFLGILTGLLGPCGLVAATLASFGAPPFRYRFIPMSEKASWAAYKERFKILANEPGARERWRMGVYY